MIRVVDLSQVIGKSSVQVVPWLGRVNLTYMRFWNVAAAGGGTIWLSRAGPAAPNQPGSYPLMPGEFELWEEPNAMPVNAVWAVSTVAGTPLTIEIA